VEDSAGDIFTEFDRFGHFSRALMQTWGIVSDRAAGSRTRVRDGARFDPLYRSLVQ
jgi:hypothetical protein